ncbi:MAG: dephospho-CoA kinase [Candidatus Atribacteria bacterium]|nr:dephospho-CoA kinase [Candidatus Atribacteria bacterium]
MLIVGLTGGIVSGKTTIARMFQELGAQVIDADEIARKVVRPGEKAWQGIVEYFGPEILREDLEINRKKLADIVFSNKEKLAVLNRITHPEITLMIKKQINQLKNKYQKNIICIVEAPLLFEAHLEDMMDKIIVVYLNREEQLKRLLLRNNLTREEAIQRIESQMPLEEKLSRADYVIDNCFSLQQTKKQVLQVWKELEHALSAKS